MMIVNGYTIKPGANLRVADLRGVDLYSADLRGADLSAADLSTTNLSWANLIGADLSAADLRGVDLYSADLRGADLSAADLRGADLSWADLRGADLRVADLRVADLSAANGIFSVGYDSRDYEFFVVQHRDGIRIKAGCRWFTMKEAQEHWLSSSYEGPPTIKARLEFIIQEVQHRGWKL